MMSIENDIRALFFARKEYYQVLLDSKNNQEIDQNIFNELITINEQIEDKLNDLEPLDRVTYLRLKSENDSFMNNFDHEMNLPDQVPNEQELKIECFKLANVLFEREFTNDMKELFRNDITLNNYLDFDNFNKNFNSLQTAILKTLVDLTAENGRKEIEVLNFLNEFLTNKYREHLDAFLGKILNSDQLEPFLFDDVDKNNVDSINSRFRRLMLIFHPDKLKHPKAVDVCAQINKCKSGLIQPLMERFESEVELIVYETRGNDYYKFVTRDEVNLNEDSAEDLFEQSNYFSLIALEEYKKACKIADRCKLIEKSIDLRAKMSKCLYYADRNIEAHITALSIMAMQKRHDKYDEYLNEMVNQLLHMINGERDFVRQTSKDLNESIKASTSLALMNYGLESTPKADRSMIKTRSGIFQANQPVGLENFISKRISQLFTVGLNLWRGKSLYSKEATHVKSFEDFFSDALDSYYTTDYVKFLQRLALPCDRFTASTDKRLLKFQNSSEFAIDPKRMVDILIDANVTPDSVAYLLNLIANALISIQLKEKARDVLEAILDEKLENEANLMDQKLSEKVKSISEIFKKPKKQSNMLLEAISSLTNDFRRKKVTFVHHLLEVQISARINLAIVNLTLNDFNSELEEETRNHLLVIRNYMDRFNECIETDSRNRLELLEFFVWILTGEEIVTQIEPQILPIDQLETEQTNQNFELKTTHLRNMISIEKNKSKKADLYCDLADEYLNYALSIESTDIFHSLNKFKKSKDSYQKARKLIESNRCILGVMKTRIKTFKFDKVLLDFEQKSWGFKENAEFWMYAAIAARKSSQKNDKNLKFALIIIDESLKIDPNLQEAIKERKILVNLIERAKKGLDGEIQKLKSTRRQLESSNFSNSRQSEDVFNILSIDGGGIRGMLPAILLGEIETRLHRPLSSVINMFAGTSTGAIIAGGLTVPNTNDPTKPAYYASDLVELYNNKSPFIFQGPNNIIKRIFTTKYSSDHRLNEFANYFGQQRIGDSLSELLIPAMNNHNHNQLEFFTRFKAREKGRYNVSYLDALMASTAAPTFFRSHRIKDLGDYFDGGLRANNPSQRAYEHAIDDLKIEPSKIYVLSFGTGLHFKSYMNASGSDGLLHWAKNLMNVLSSSNEIETEKNLNRILKKKHMRFQKFLSRDIELDDWREIPNLVDIGFEFIEELDNSDENKLNKVVEHLSRYV